jgi:hypothetical protein
MVEGHQGLRNEGGIAGSLMRVAITMAAPVFQLSCPAKTRHPVTPRLDFCKHAVVTGSSAFVDDDSAFVVPQVGLA